MTNHYTQLTDVEIEVNGYVTYDRAVENMDLKLMAAAHRKLLREFTAEAPRAQRF